MPQRHEIAGQHACCDALRARLSVLIPKSMPKRHDRMRNANAPAGGPGHSNLEMVRERGSGPPLNRAGRIEASVGLDLPEAIGAVDGPIHARLERNLRLVATRRTDHGEVLAGDVVLTSFVAARTADVADVVACLATRPPAGSTAGAALRIRGESLLDVVLLIGGRVDELHPAVDTGQRSVSVGHEAFLSSGRSWPGRSGRPHRQTGRCGCVGKVRRRYPGAVMESLSSGRTGCSMAAPYTDVLKPALHGAGDGIGRIPESPMGWRS